jgi:uncharacterized membrane protein
VSADPKKPDGISLRDPNLAGALAYLFGIVTGLVFLALDEREYVRFHAMQSIVFFLFVLVLYFVLDGIPVIRVVTGPLTQAVAVVWVALMFNALFGRRFKLPYVGDFAERQLAKDSTRP